MGRRNLICETLLSSENDQVFSESAARVSRKFKRRRCSSRAQAHIRCWTSEAGQQLQLPVRRRIRNPYIGRVAIMIRFLLRFLGLLSLALGFIFLVYDGAKSIVDQRLYISSVREAWNSVSDGSLAQLQSALQRMMPGLWDPVAVTILDTPVALVLAILGALLLLLGRKKKPLIGYARS
jgi:hypothetical protein